MSAFLKLTTTSRTGSYLGIPSEAKDLVRPASDNMGVVIAAAHAEVLSGDQKGELVTEVKTNQVVRIRPCVQLNPYKYTILQGYNPRLAEYGAVSMSTVVQPNANELYLVMKAYKPFRLEEFDWLFLFYMID